jgi:hypothetical protein
MAHYAYVNEDGLVVDVITGRHEDETVNGVTDWEQYYGAQRAGLSALRTSFNTRGGVHYDPKTGKPSKDQSKAFRGNYAGIGFTYDKALDAFIPPKPSEDATLDETTFSWIVPDVDTDDEE